MAVPLSINNPQEQLTSVPVTNTFGPITSTFGGNVIGGGSTSTSGASTDFSTILLYGAIALFGVWILKKIDS
jgi:hypothetical protein